MIEAEDIPLTLKAFTKIHSYPTMGALRKLVYHSDSNGLKSAFLKVGRRRLVLPKTLFKLLKEMGSQWSPKVRGSHEEEFYTKDQSKTSHRAKASRKI
jgi:hypothetical protein